jgi:hypothetical protein
MKSILHRLAESMTYYLRADEILVLYKFVQSVRDGKADPESTEEFYTELLAAIEKFQPEVFETLLVK